MIGRIVTKENGFSYSEYIDEPITDNIRNSVDDFYNLMHLIENALANYNAEIEIEEDDDRIFPNALYSKNFSTSQKYELKWHEAGYDIFSKDGTHEAWIGIKDKGYLLERTVNELGAADYLEFVIFLNSKFEEKLEKYFDACGSGVYPAITYSQLKLSDITREKTEEKQREVIKTWIDKTFENALAGGKPQVLCMY